MYTVRIFSNRVCTERHTCDLIDKKDLGGLVRPSLDVNSVVNVADKLLTQIIEETNITLQKNIIQKIQIGTLKVVHEKKNRSF